MAKFSKENFMRILVEIEDMFSADQNIDVPIGILEIMYEDYSGYLNYYFHTIPESARKTNVERDRLWAKLNK